MSVSLNTLGTLRIVEQNSSTGEAMLEQSITIKGCASIAENYRNTREVAPVEYNRRAAEPEK